MKLTKQHLKNLIKEEFIRRLNELHPGSSMGSHLKQGIAKLWEADNMFQRALAEAETNEEHAAVDSIHKQIEKLAFEADNKMHGIIAGDVNNTKLPASGQPAKKKAPPPPPKRNSAV